LQEKVMREEIVGYVLERFEAEIQKAFASMSDEIEEMRRRKAVLESEIRNLVTGLATGIKSTAVMGDIAMREREISEISHRLLSSKPDSIHSRIDKLRATAVARIKNIRGLLGGDVTVARAELLKHVQKITLERDGKTYVAAGNWSLLGDVPWDGAGGPVRTTRARFSLPLAA
jgi:hypothetical protein